MLKAKHRLRMLEVVAATGKGRHTLLSVAEVAELDHLPEADNWRRFAELLAERLPAEVLAQIEYVYGHS